MYFYLAEKLRYYDDYKKRQLRRQQPFHPHGQTVHRAGGQDGASSALARSAEKWLIAQAFGCRVIYYSTSGAHDDPDYERVDLYRLLKDSDVVSIHAPLNE